MGSRCGQPVTSLVSIIVATYRREQVLCNTLNYLLAQDYPNCELIVVDQSPRHEPATLEHLQRLRSSLRYLKLEEANLPAARNYAVRHSRGDIIVFFDDDVVVQPDCISCLVKTYADPDVWSATGFVLGAGESDLDVYRRHFGPGVRREDVARRPTFRSDRFIGCFMSFRRQIFDRVGYFDEWLGTQPMAAGEDIDFCRRLLQAGFGVHLNPAILVRHLAAMRGGCDRRSLDALVVHREQARLNAYIVFKNRVYPGPLGWIHAFGRCYRQTVLVNSFLRPWRVLQHHAAMYEGFRDALRAKPGSVQPETALAGMEEGSGRC
jgi:GT2 family glycosyltransferase